MTSAILMILQDSFITRLDSNMNVFLNRSADIAKEYSLVVAVAITSLKRL